MYKYNATALRVVDGDTLIVRVDLGFHVFINIHVRVLDIDTYELKGEFREYGLKIKEEVTKLLEGRNIIIESFKTDSELKTDKYGRWLCNVYYIDDCDNSLKNFKEWIDSKNFNKYSKEQPDFEQ